MNYEILIIGSDANAYYMARCYHELTGKKADVLAKSPLPYTTYSSILNIAYDPSIWQEEGFLKALADYRKTHSGRPILLISSNESYAELIAANRERLQKQGFVFNYPDAAVARSLMMKEEFYKQYADSCLDLPVTCYFDCKNQDSVDFSLPYPVIVKPSNVIQYNHLSFEGKNKIYKVDSQDELNRVISLIKAGGYTDTLIVQEFIPGDDSYLFDAVAYVDSSHRVRLLSFAQIGLQEHSRNMVGNAAVLINGYNQFGHTHEVEAKMKQFLEEIGYSGFAEFDLKYDPRDQKFKVLEINARQGRSSYYLTALGENLVQVLAEDLIDRKVREYRFLNDRVLLSFVPKKVALRYIVNEDYKREVKKLWHGHIDPVRYKEDRNFMRKIYLLKKRLRYVKEYQNSYWKVI